MDLNHIAEYQIQWYHRKLNRSLVNLNHSITFSDIIKQWVIFLRIWIMLYTIKNSNLLVLRKYWIIKYRIRFTGIKKAESFSYESKSCSIVLEKAHRNYWIIFLWIWFRFRLWICIISCIISDSLVLSNAESFLWIWII